MNLKVALENMVGNWLWISVGRDWRSAVSTCVNRCRALMAGNPRRFCFSVILRRCLGYMILLWPEVLLRPSQVP